MSLDRHVLPWRGHGYRHLPSRPGVDPLDFSFSGRGTENRWNESDSPTLYLAGDEGVLITEWGRHLRRDRTKDIGRGATIRTIYRFDLRLRGVVDLCNAAVWRELSLSSAPTCFLDRRIALDTADVIRNQTSAQGILVPPVGLLDQPERWNLVLFLEKLDEDLSFITKVTPLGELRFE